MTRLWQISIIICVFYCNGISAKFDIVGGYNTTYTFPKDFLFGVSTSSIQVEGAWDEDGKGESIWDYAGHHRTVEIVEEVTADVASDSYHQYKRDVEIVRELGANVYRFSISWPRILPNGFSNNINPKGIEYYHNLLDELLKYNITPIVTIYHWDLPQDLEDIGGWLNEHIVEYFTDYAKVLFENYGSKVKYWTTFNEPHQVCFDGYGGSLHPPALNISGIADYICSRNLLLAHASVYHLYDKQYKPFYEGQVGISIVANWGQPHDPENEHDRKSSELYMQAHYGWFAHPIYSPEGNFHPDMIKAVDEKSRQQNYTRSRLPKFTPQEVEFIQGTGDYFGLNHYTTYFTKQAEKDVGDIPSHENDISIIRFQDPSWPSKSSATWLKVVPVGFRKLLKWMSKAYPNVPIIVTENGYASNAELDDQTRVAYLAHYMNALLHSIHEDKVDVRGYVVWSMIDNFEWNNGFRMRFGLYSVDFNSPNKTRTPRSSAAFFSNVIAKRTLPENYDPKDFSVFFDSSDMTTTTARSLN